MNDILRDFKAWRKENDLPFNPNFVPHSYDSIKDLEHGYWKRESAAVMLEQELKQKAATTPSALPSSQPKKTLPLIRKGEDGFMIRKTGSFGREEVKLLLDYVDDTQKFLLDVREKDLATLQEALDKRLLWRGTWRAGESYVANDLVQDKGTIFVCTAAKSEERPGSGPGWRMLVKTGGAK